MFWSGFIGELRKNIVGFIEQDHSVGWFSGLRLVERCELNRLTGDF